MTDDPALRVEFKNSKPVELLDLTASLMALGEAYEEYAAETQPDPHPRNIKLYIRELRSSSIIADLQSLVEQGTFIIEHREVLAGFLVNFGDLVSFFLLGKWERDGEPGVRQSERVAQVFEPVAKDEGSQLILQITGDMNINQHFYDSKQANIIQNRVRRHLGPSLPTTTTFQSEPMYLIQVRDDPKGQVGDRGIIEKYSSPPVRLRFMNEAAKKAVLEYGGGLFKSIFVVDGEVGFADGNKPRLYKISVVQDAFPRDS